MTDARCVVILGGGYAGLMTAARLAQRQPADRITLVDASPTFVERIRLHQAMAGQRLRRRALRALLPKRVAFLQGRAVGWDVAGRRLSVDTHEGARNVSYDRLVYALGSTVDVTRVPGVSTHARALGGQEDAERLGAVLVSLPAGKRVLVVGGGLTGIEAAAELAEARPDLRVELAAPEPPAAAFAPAGAAHLERVFARLRVAVHAGVRVTALDAGAAHLADGRALPFDVCLWAAGFVAPSLAAHAGLPVNARGQLVVDATLRVPGHPEILAAGDAAAVSAAGATLRMACATAMPMGTFVADELARERAGEAPRPFRFAYMIQCVSLGRRDGLVQRVGPDDRPLPKVWTGRRAAFIKEMVCRSTVLSIRAERRGVRMYRWPAPPRPVGAAPVAGYVGAE